MQEFAVASVVIPANDGTLKGLGFDVRELGERALGFVVETRAGKAQVQFPELCLTLWLDKRELADVYFQAENGKTEYKSFLPEPGEALRGRNLAWIVNRLFSIADARYILHCEVAGTLTELWSDSFQKMEEFYQGDQSGRGAHLGLGLPELSLEKWHEVEKYLGEELYFARFLPAGMHKLELSLYLKR